MKPIGKDPTSSESTKYLIVAIGVAALLRFGLSGFPLHDDELTTTSIFAQLPFFQIFVNYQFPNNHIFHTLLVHLLLETFGLHEPILRLPVLLGSIASLIYAFRTTHLITGNRWGSLLVVLFLSFNYEHLYFSTNARGYILITLIAQIVVHRLLQQYRADTPSTLPWYTWSWITLLLIIGTWTIPTFALFEASVVMWAGCFALYQSWKHQSFRTVFSSYLEIQLMITGIVGLAMVYVQYAVIIPRHIFITALGSPEADPSYLDYLLGTIQGLGNGIAIQLTVLILVAIGFFALLQRRSRAFGLLACVSMGVVFPLVAEMLGLLKGLPPVRVFLYFQPLILAVAVMGILTLVRQPVWFRRVVGVLAGVLLVEGAWTYYDRLITPYRQRADYHQVRQFIEELGPQDLFLGSEKTHVWMYLYANPGMRDRVLNIINTGNLDNIFFLESQEFSSSDLALESRGNSQYVLLQRQYAANALTRPTIAIPNHFTELVHDWGLLRIHRIKPEFIHPQFSVLRDSLEKKFMMAQAAPLQFIPEIPAIEEAKRLQSVLLTEGPLERMLLLDQQPSPAQADRPRLSLHFLYTSIGVRNTAIYASGRSDADAQLEITPVWILNRWTAEHPYSDLVYERAWFPRIYLTDSLGREEYLMLYNIPSGQHGVANMHSFWIGE